MSQPTPFAIDDLIICDYSNWFSTFKPDAMGLAGATIRRSPRVGRWPLLAGVDRGDRKLTMQTTFNHTVEADREAARLLLFKNLNYETETVRRLVAADGMIYDAAPTHVLLACGPMVIHRDAGVWYVEDLLQRYDGTLGGGWWTEPDSGIQLVEVATNMVLNPSAEAAGNFALKGAATITADTTYSYRGGSAFKIVTTALVGDGMSMTMSALTNAVHYMTARIYGECLVLQFSLNNADWSTPVLLGIDGDWYIYGWQFPAIQANASTTLYIQQSDAVAKTLYIDAVQVEASSYPTSYLDGSCGFGHSFSGAAHATTSARTAATLKFTNVLSSTQGTLALTWTPIAGNTAGTRYLFSEGNIKAYFNSTDDKITFTDGVNTIATDALTFNGMITQRLAFTWSSNGLKVYRNGALAASGVTYTVPALGTYLFIGSTTASLSQASGWIDDLVVLDTEATTTTIAQLGNGALARARWLDVMCESAQAMNSANYGIVSTLGIDDNVRWQSRDGDVAFWRVYAATDNFWIDNKGDDDAYPIFHLTTKTAKTSGAAYSRYIFIVWRAAVAGTNYPVRITLPDLTATAQADGDDIRVIVDGTEVDRWLDGTVAAYNVWVNLNFEAAPTACILSTQILIGDATTTIYLSGSTSTWPSTGVVLIESEAFTYTGKDGSTLTGVTRACKNTVAAAHAATTAVYLIQRDIVITYGDGAATAPTVDADYKPAFELSTGTNTSWAYAVFGDDNLKRTGAWAFSCIMGEATKYTANHGTTATPWTEIGSLCVAKRYGFGVWTLYNPCGITAGNFTNGEYYCEVGITNADWHIWSSKDGVRPADYNYSDTMTIDNAWHNWSQNATTLYTGARYLVFAIDVDTYTAGNGTKVCYGEVADVTVTVNSSYIPVITIGAEASSGAPFAPTITNVTTGKSITLSAAIGVDVTMTVDTANKTLTLTDGSSRLDAITLDSARRDWLRLMSGINQFTFSDTGTVKLEIEIEWNRQYIE